MNSVALDPLPTLPDDHDLVSSKGVRKEFGDVSLMTLWRWRNEPKYPRLRFPAPDVVINDHNYWYRKTSPPISAANQDVEVRPRECGFFR